MPDSEVARAANRTEKAVRRTREKLRILAYQSPFRHFRRMITKAAKQSAMRLSVTRTARTCPIEIAANISP